MNAPSRQQQFYDGICRILEKNPSLRSPAEKIWLRLRNNPESKSASLPPGNPADYRNLFLNCIKMRNDRPVLDLEALHRQLEEDFPLWLQALQKAGNFTPPPVRSDLEELIGRLRFVIPEIDWEEFRRDLTRNTEIDYLKDAWKTTEYLLKSHEDIAPAALGSQLFHNSKRLKNATILNWVCRFLRQKTGIDDSCDNRELLNKLGLVENSTASLVTVYGPFQYKAGGVSYSWIEQLWQANQSATLSADNLQELSEIRIGRPVLTIENETVFNLMKQDAQDFALVYTAGFPGRAVQKWIQALSPETPLFHWGDCDPEGYEIAAILNHLHPLKLFRCSTEELDSLKPFAQPLPETKRRRAKRLSEDGNFPFPAEIQWILSNQCWIEQEAFFAEKSPLSPRR